MTLKQLFKTLADDAKWEFHYGREEYQNLNELELDKVGLFVDPITEDPKFSEYGQPTMAYFGRFLLLMNSDVDEDYPEKAENYIDKLKETELPIILAKLQCENYQINSFRILEAINIYDQNLDGLLVNYNVTLID